MAQQNAVNVSGSVKNKVSGETLNFVNVVLENPVDTSFVAGTITNDHGLFTLSDVKPGDYLIEVSYIGFKKYTAPLYLGANSAFIDLGAIWMEENVQQLETQVIRLGYNYKF
jgi:hypothetical protein